MLTLLEISDVKGTPRVKLDLPEVASVGTRIRLRFRLNRTSNGRSEVLRVDGQFKVEALGIDGGVVPRRQVISVTSVGVTPVWRSIKKDPHCSRVLPPAKSLRTKVE